MNQDSFIKPDNYSPINKPPEEEKQPPDYAFGSSDSDSFKRPPFEKIEPIPKSDNIFISQRVQKNHQSLVTPANQLKTSSTPRDLKSIFAIGEKKKTDDINIHFEFTKWQRCQIISYHLMEPVLVASLLGACLNMPQFNCVCVIVVTMSLYLPLLLTAITRRIKLKIVFTMVLLVSVFLYLIFKLVVYFMQYPYFVENRFFSEFLGIYFGLWVQTFVIDIVLLVLISLLLWIQISQLKQRRLGIELGERKLSKQIEVKFLHPIFGNSLFVFYTIAYLLFLLDTFFYQTFVQLGILTCQLIQCYAWTIKVEISIQAYKYTLRAMQLVCFLTLAIGYIFQMPYLFNGFIYNPENQRLIELLGYIQLTKIPAWHWRTHIVMLSCAIILSEVFFVADSIKQKNPLRPTKKVEENNLMKRRVGVVLSKDLDIRRKIEQSDRLKQYEQFWQILKNPLTLWISRISCFLWAYAYHDFQSLIVLVWLVHSTLYVKSSIFVKCTAYFYLPIFNLLMLWYFTINVYGLFVYWDDRTSPKTLFWYSFGFYNMAYPPLELALMFFILFIVSYYCRLNFEKREIGINTGQIIDELSNNKSTLWQIVYLVVLYVEYPLFLAMVMFGLSKMDFYHTSLLFVFVAYTLFPKVIGKYALMFLIYADFFVLTNYAWTLVTKTNQQPGWLKIIGISSDYNPQQTQEYFRDPPQFDQWFLVLITFALYRRSNLVGMDISKIREQELECVKEIYYKSPTTKKIFTTVDILINHCVIIFTFLLFLLILVYIRRSFLNLISLMLVLIVICSYMSKGISHLNFYWNILTFYQAFVLLSITFFQFISKSGLSQQKWFVEKAEAESEIVQVFFFFAGYYKFNSPIYWRFFPYVILFSFAVLIRDRFRAKAEMENQKIVLPSPDDNLLYSFQDDPRQSSSLTSSYISGIQNPSLTRKQAERRLTNYQIQLQDNYYKMLYQIQYPVWKIKVIWPVIDLYSRYHNFFQCILIFCFSLYYQIALIWLIFLIIYVLQAWQVSSMHQKYMVGQYNEFKTAKQIRRTEMSNNSRTRSNTMISDDQNDEQKGRLKITDQEVLNEYEIFKRNVNEIALESRHVYWMTQFILVIVAIFFVYMSDFITATFVDPDSGKSLTLITNENIRNRTILFYFWFGFMRQMPLLELSLQDSQALIQAYYPFFMLVIVLIIEKLSQMWLIDKFGTTDEVIKQWKEIERLYNEIFKGQDEVKSQLETMKEEQKSQRKSKLIQENFESQKLIRTPLEVNQERFQTFNQQSFPDKDISLPGKYESEPNRFFESINSSPRSERTSIITPRSQSLLLLDAIEDESKLRGRPVSFNLSEFDFDGANLEPRPSFLNKFDQKSKAYIEEIKSSLKPLLTVKSKVAFNKCLQICFEEFIILLLWFSCIYKQSIYSYFIFAALVYHTFYKNQRTSDSPMLLVRYMFAFIIICEYIVFLTNLTSYNSPATFPAALTPQVTINDKVYTSPYPSWNNDTNEALYYYFYLPLYFQMPKANDSSPPSVNVDLITYFGVFVTNDQQNGLWIDFIITLLVVFYLDTCNFFILTKKIKVVGSEECDAQILNYQNVMKYNNKTTKEVKKELSIMIRENRFMDYWAKWLYQDFILVMIAFIIIISIYSRTILSYGYFLFCMILIFQSRKFFVTENSHKLQRKILRRGLLPYLLLDILLQLIYQLPIKLFDDNSKWSKIVGFEHYWNSTPNTLQLGYIGEVNTVLTEPLTPLYLKGVAYLCIMIQLAIIESRGFKNFKRKFTSENLENKDLIGKGIAYRFNNFKSKKILKSAKAFSEIQKMLADVKTLLNRRDKMFKAKQDFIATGKMSKKNFGEMLSQVDEEHELLEQPKYDIKKQFNIEVKKEIEARMKGLGALRKIYLWLRRNFVQDILFKRSPGHLIEIVNDFQNGRTCEKTNFERGLIIKVQQDLLQKVKDEVEKENTERQLRLAKLKIEVDAEIYLLAERAENEKAQEQRLEYLQFRTKILSKMQLKPWQKIDLETFDSWKTLGMNYLSLIYKIISSYTEWICYIFMLSATYSNAGLLYMVYPFMIFGYALLEESKPTSRFWFITIMYTQLIILVQFTVQLTVWNYYFVEETTKMYAWTLQINLGIVYLEQFTFKNCLLQFLPEILIVMSVLVHIQLETLQGVLDKPPWTFESFEDGLKRYRLNINKDDTETYDELKNQFQEAVVIKQHLDFEDNLNTMLRKRSWSEDLKDLVQVGGKVLINNPILKSNEEILDQPKKRSWSMDDLVSQKPKDVEQTAVQKVKQKIAGLFLENSFFQRLFPQIKQQKPGKDYYVWTTFISFILCLYIILFFTQMSGQKTTLADQYNSNQFQAYMVLTLFVMITIMVIDRIFYGSHAQLTTYDKKQSEQEQPKETATDQQLSKSQTKIIRTVSFDANKISPTSSSQYSKQKGPLGTLNASVHSNQDITTSEQVDDRASSFKSEQDILDEEEEVLKMKAYEEALTPVIRKNSWTRIIKVYYYWYVLILVHWYVFFSMTDQQKYCAENQKSRAFCNKFKNNSALIVFYTLFVFYFILQAYQLQMGMPELRKGGFMIDQYDTVSKTIFQTWYYIPFLFELRSVIDWTFSETALDIFQWLKLAQIQANMYLSKCVQKGYREKELGSKITMPQKIGLGCGLMLLILTLIAGPMLLFSNINPVSTENSVDGGILQFTLNIENTVQQTNYNVNLYETRQMTSLHNLTEDQFKNLGFENYTTTTAVFYPYQVQALEFAESSDTVWIVSKPTRTMILEALQSVQNEEPGLSITAQLTSQFIRPSGTLKYQQTLPLTNQTEPTIIDTLINQINCTGTTQPIQNQFPNDMVCITVNAGTTASGLQCPPYWSGFSLNYYCSQTNPASSYWSVSQTFDTNDVDSQIIQTYNTLFPDVGFGFFTFSQNTLPKALSSYSSSILLFYGTIVYVVASALRSGLVPFSYQIFISDAPLTEDILMICTSIHIYRMQHDLEQEEELYYILIDIMRSPEMIKELSKSSLKKPQQPPEKQVIKSS